MKQKVFIGVYFISMLYLASSCDIFDIIDIDFTTDGGEIILEVQPHSATEFYKTYEDVESDIKQQIEDHGGKIENLESIIIKDITIEIISGADNFNALKNAEVSISTNELTDKKLAWIDEIPLNITKLYPEHTTDNLKDYLEVENYIITISGEVRDDIIEPVQIKVIIKYEITL